MKFGIILNGCSNTYQAQAEEINGFMKTSLSSGFLGETFIFYDRDERKEAMVRYAPTVELSLIKVGRYQPETILKFLECLPQTKEKTLYIFPGDFAGSELSVRFASRVGGSSLVAVDHVDFTEKGLVCTKPIYANYLLGFFEMNQPPFCVSLLKGGNEREPISNTIEHHITEYDIAFKVDGFVKEHQFKPKEKTTGLDLAPFILAGGSGMGSRKAVQDIQKAAAEIDAEFGVTRPVAMNGWIEMSRMIGVSGVITDPKLSLVVGASGSAAFMAGVKKSDFIISINHDVNAPVVKQSDVAVIDDYVPVMDALIEIIKTDQSKPGKQGYSA